MTSWKCPKCRFKIPDLKRYPVACRCGFIDDGNAKTLSERAFAFAKAAKQHVAAGSPMATQQQIDARLDVCRSCQHFTGKMCNLCGCYVNQGKWMNKLAWLDQGCPDERWGATDLLIPLHGKPSSGWWYIRGTIVADFCRSLGHSARVVSVGERSPKSLQQLVDAHQPRIVINRAMQYNRETVERVAIANPSVRFVTVNHSSQSHLLHASHWIQHQAEHIELANRLPNVWFGLVDERLPISGHARTIWLPNLVPQIRSEVGRESSAPRTASAIGRWDWAKNWPNQFAAAGKAHVDVLAVIRTERPRDIEAMSTTYGVPAVRQMQWSEHWQEHIDRIARWVDVGLQCSFTESFNYVALEHLALGRPVVGSPAIRYLPPDWQANPDDPLAIAGVLMRLLDGDHTQQAKGIADAVQRRNAEAFTEAIGGLLR